MKEEKEFKDLLGGCLAQLIRTLASYAVLGVATIYGGFITMYLWNGIIATTFGIATITLAQGAGIDLFVSFLTMQRIDQENKGALWTALYVLGTNSIVWLIGWIIIQFV